MSDSQRQSQAPRNDTASEVVAYIGLGANLGDRDGQIRRGLEQLEEMHAAVVLEVSSLYESEPVGWSGGPSYLNGVARVSTKLAARELLHKLEEVEILAGRSEGERNSPRPLDLDILLYDGTKIETRDLVIPHPRMKERAFVLWPLAEIAPDVELGPGLTARRAADSLTDHEQIRLWKLRE